MNDASNKFLMMVEPDNDRSEQPIIDRLTRLAAGLLNVATHPNYSTRGVHACTCGATSDCQIWHLVGGEVETNYLLAHYVAYHRDEISASEIAKLERLAVASGAVEAEPTDSQLEGSGIAAFTV